MNMDENIYGKSVRKARLKRGFSQAEMAEMLDISRNYLSLIETGAKVPKKSLRTIIDHLIDHGAVKYDASGGVVQTMHGNSRQAGRDMIPLGHCARASSTLALGTINRWVAGIVENK
jgi:ribosome-binding protein aMBF1 (putative translation factor)